MVLGLGSGAGSAYRQRVQRLLGHASLRGPPRRRARPAQPIGINQGFRLCRTTVPALRDQGAAQPYCPQSKSVSWLWQAHDAWFPSKATLQPSVAKHKTGERVCQQMGQAQDLGATSTSALAASHPASAAAMTRWSDCCPAASVPLPAHTEAQPHIIYVMLLAPLLLL